MGKLLTDNLLDEGRHPHALYDEVGSCAMHGLQKLATRIVNTGDFLQIDFDSLPQTSVRTPNGLGFGNLGAPKFARELEATSRVIVMERDS